MGIGLWGLSPLRDPNSAPAHREFSGYHPKLITRGISRELRAKETLGSRAKFRQKKTATPPEGGVFTDGIDGVDKIDCIDGGPN